MTKILAIDDHPLIQDALSQLLPQLGNDVVVRNAVNTIEAMAILDNEPDISLILLDLALPDARGLDFLSDLMQDYPGVPVVVLSATHDRATVNASLAAGARGFIAKTSNAQELLEAVRQCIAGIEYLTPDITLEPDADGVRIAPGALGLTARQADVLMQLVQGKPNKLICRDLKLSEGTVKVHVSAILKRLNVRTRAQAVATLARRGISVETLARRSTRPETLAARR